MYKFLLPTATLCKSSLLYMQILFFPFSESGGFTDVALQTMSTPSFPAGHVHVTLDGPERHQQKCSTGVQEDAEGELAHQRSSF